MLKKNQSTMNKPLFSTLFSLWMILALVAPPPLLQVAHASTGGDILNANSRRAAPVQGIARQEFPVSEGANAQQGLQIVLGEGAEQPSAPSQLPVADATPLDAAETAQIIDRLPALETDPEDVQEFRLPVESLPPPRAGETITETFPPQQDEASAPAVESGPLQVLRYAPEGEIPLAPFLNVTFNQPMAPLSTLQQLAAQDVPVKITPEVPGVWKWLGTRTLSFEYESDDIDRFPMATEFTVEIPAGTESATGGVLEEAVSWTFRTPAPIVQSYLPSSSPQSREPLFYVQFDQRIDPAAVLETVNVRAQGQSYAVRLATDDEIAADERVQNLRENAPENRWLAFRTEQRLPADSTIAVDIGPGTPSAEGPLTTERVQSFSFQTYGSLRVIEHRCGYGPCSPFTPFIIHFNNPLDEDAFDESWITIEPELPGATINNFGNTLEIRGPTQGRTTYKVTLNTDLLDIFGQTLEKEQVLEFQVGSAMPVLSGPNDMMITLDPSSAPAFTVYSINYTNLRYRIYAVQPTDWPAYQQYHDNFWRNTTPPDPPGTLLEENIMTIQAQPDELVETPIALSKVLPDGYGHLIVVVDLPLDINLKNRDSRNQVVQSWVQVTQMGLDAFVDHSEMTAWANDLNNGAPLADVELSLLSTQVAAVTGADGTAKLELPSQSSPLLVARNGDDIAILPQSAYSGGGWQRTPVQDELTWYVWDDRQMYRPGEEVHVKGWVRRIGGKQDGDVGLLAGAQNALNYIVSDPQGNQLTAGNAQLNAAGGFDLAFSLPENANLGYATLQLTLAGSVSNLNSRDYWHSFQIQEFRRPEFEVSAGNESTGPFFVGGEAVTFVRAAYFAGGPLPNAETFWNVNATPTSYSPPNWSGYIFGSWTPWWRFSDIYYGDDFGGGGSYASYNSRTDAAGTHYLKMEFPSATEPRPYSVQASASVMDVNRQAWESSTTLLVHPADLYVGLRSERTFVERGKPLEIEAVAVDIDGKAVSGRTLNLRAARLEWKYSKGQWNEEEADVQECTLTSSAFPQESPTICSFTTEQGGSYRITATVEDEQGRLNQTVMTRWVSGGKRPPARQIEREEVTLIPDKEEYQPGDVAEILVQSPFAPAEGVLTISRNGILSTARFQMETESTILNVSVEERHIPDLHVQVDLVGAAPRLDDAGEVAPDLPTRPAYASGSLNLSVPPLMRTLALDVTPAETSLSPGAQTTLDLALTDAAGEPVADAEMAVIIVDEAILALTGYQLTDPIAIFYGGRGSGFSDYHSRASIVLANPLALAQQVSEQQEMMMFSRSVAPMAAGAPAPMADIAAESAVSDEDSALNMVIGKSAGADGESANANQPDIALRTNFNPLALFAPSVTTDAEGRAQVDIQLPDNLTRYRIMVVAVAGGNQFGSAEANLTARLPLMVRPSAPRFLNFGDRFELPIVLQNQTDEEMEVNVAVQASNITLTDAAQTQTDNERGQPESAGQTVIVPANDRVEVRFPAAAMSAGTARFQIAAVAGENADAATVELPVYTPATTEAFAVYGVVDEGAIIQPVAKPADVFPQFGGLEIQTSSTALQALTDALLYLAAYPYDCSEQLASRIMAIATLRDVLTAFDAAGLPTSDEMMATVERDAKTLQSLQNDNGGWPVWTRGRDSVPYYSIFVAHALQVARDKGFPVTEQSRQLSLQYLRQIEQYYPSWYSQETRWSLSAYALNVRNLMNDVDGPKARALFAESGVDKMPLEGLAWLLPILADDPSAAASADAIRQHFNNRAVETAGAANFTTSYGDDEYVMLHSNRRTDGILLDALITDQPESDLIPKVVNGLLAHRTRGRWGNTQENAFILLALDHYFNTFEAQTPDFVANIWLGETYAGGHEFVGRTTERHETNIPMRYLVEQDAADLQDLIVGKEGDGRLYYRLGLRYAPTDLEMPPLDMGFVVQREYQAVDDPQDVSRDEDGTWRIRAGARVRVRVTMVADSRRYHVALVDPLPAGLEIINPALAVSEGVPADPNDNSGRSWWWWGPWYEHQNLRDQRAEAFTSLLWDGVYTYSYVARATTPGEFVVPPAKAEEMYSPEVFGRSAVDKVIIK